VMLVFAVRLTPDPETAKIKEKHEKRQRNAKTNKRERKCQIINQFWDKVTNKQNKT